MSDHGITFSHLIACLTPFANLDSSISWMTKLPGGTLIIHSNYPKSRVDISQTAFTCGVEFNQVDSNPFNRIRSRISSNYKVGEK